MSPTCTLPYEVLFELANATAECVTMQVVADDAEGGRAGPTILMRPHETLSLVITAGVLYRYVIKRPDAEANLL